MEFKQSAGQHINNIMLIDDDPASNYINEIFLKKTGMVDNVWKYTQARRALEKLLYISNKAGPGEKAELPEIIILDLKMPVMDGFEFLDAFDEMVNIKKSNTQVYVLTSSDYPRDIEKVKQYGIAGIISKPIDYEKGKKIIGDSLNRNN